VKTHVEFQLTVPVKTSKRRNWYLASCPILDVSSQGETEDKAKENLVEALTLFLISCFERGTLDAALKECGFVPSSPTVVQEPVKKPLNYVNVPLPFTIDSRKAITCRV